MIPPCRIGGAGSERGNGISTFSIRRAATDADYRVFGRLAREYIVALNFDLDFQARDVDILKPSVDYGPGNRGAALLAVGADHDAVGITGIRDLGSGRCELKRMYVRPGWRGQGIGRMLCDEAVLVARSLGYAAIRLDTLSRLRPATRLYLAAGFRPIEPYRANRFPDALFFELNL